MKLSGIYFTVATVFFVLALGALGLQRGNIWIAGILAVATVSLFVAAVAARKSENKKSKISNLQLDDSGSDE